MLMRTEKRTVDLTVFCPFNGIGVGARGFLDATPELADIKGRWRCVGGIDVDARANANAARLCGVPFTTMDLMSREQYRAYHGKEPPAGWREATPADVLAAAGFITPMVVMSSPPCQGYSGLLSESLSLTAKYQALNELALRGIWLCLEAFKDDPAAFYLIENVPRIQVRGRRFLDQMTGLLHAYGYAVAETTHDCGEIGNLAQSRKRFLMVARNMAKVPNYLYQPPSRPLRAVGDVLGKLPVPRLDAEGLHRLPSLQWKTWVRLAFVEAGSDWRSLNRLRVDGGQLADFGLVPERPYYPGTLGVQHWHTPSATLTGKSRPSCGAFAVADPRFDARGNDYCQYGVHLWTDPTGAMIAVKSPGQGKFSVADPRGAAAAGRYRVVRLAEHDGQRLEDPRFAWDRAAHQNKFRVGPWSEPTGTVIGTSKGPGSGALAVADPRPGWEARRGNNLIVSEWDEASNTIIGGGKGVQGGWLSVADPRPGLASARTGQYRTAGHYGVVPWSEHSNAITGSGGHDNGSNNVADPRLPEPAEKLGCIIVAEDNTWHRPFTTLEVAALQSIFDPEAYQHFQLYGRGDGELRTWIGNAIPRAAAKAMAEQFGQALLLAITGQTLILTASSVWVQPMIAAIQCGDTGAAQ